MPPGFREALAFWGYDVFPGWHYPTRRRAGKDKRCASRPCLFAGLRERLPLPEKALFGAGTISTIGACAAGRAQCGALCNSPSAVHMPAAEENHS